MAGDDARTLERISRYSTPGDVAKALIEAQTKLSQRQEPLKLTEASTPEQITEYRRASDVPDVPREAKDEAYAEAYGLKLPDGVNVPPALLGAFAKQMNAKHMPKAMVQSVIGEYAKIQAGIDQQVERVAMDKRAEWHGKLRDELGSREYDGRKKAASDYLQDQFAGRGQELQDLLGAQLPSGGYLGDHPWLFNLIAEKAIGAGFTDRIEANAIESTGKSLAARQSELEALRRTNRDLYNAPATQEALKKVIGLRLGRGEIDEMGNETRKRA